MSIKTSYTPKQTRSFHKKVFFEYVWPGDQAIEDQVLKS